MMELEERILEVFSASRERWTPQELAQSLSVSEADVQAALQRLQFSFKACPFDGRWTLNRPPTQEELQTLEGLRGLAARTSLC